MPTKDWTVLVYMGADDADDAELAAAAFKDLEEMRRIGSSDRTNVAVQMDLHLFPPVRFLIRQDGTLDVTKARGLGLRRESNSGRPGTLLSFLKWAIVNASAHHYLLILWGHGLGVGFSVEIAKTEADVVFDGEDALTIPQLAGVLRRFRSITGKPLDLLGFDACYMAAAEVGYEFRDLVQFMVGSQITLPFEGWPYEPVLRYLRTHPRAKPASVAKTIARAVVESYSHRSIVTQTAFRPAGADDVAAATQGLVIALERAVGNDGEARAIRRAFTRAKFFGARQFLDLKDLCQRLARNCRAPEVRASARKTADTLDRRVKGLVIDHRTRGRLARGLNGASIYVDWVKSKQGEEKVNLKPKNYRLLQFVQATGWQEFNSRFGRLRIR
jgi:hypothetical protein